MCAVSYRTGNSVIEISGKSTTGIVGICHTIVYLARCGVTIVVGGIVLVAGKHFLTVYVRIKVAHVLGVAMTETCGGQSQTIVVNHHRTPYYLVASVPVDVGDRVVVVALSIPRRTRLVVSPSPSHVESMCSRVNVVGNKLVTSVDASSQKDARMLTVEIWRTKEVLAASVSVAVTPCSLKVGFAALVSFQRILNTLVWFARSSFAVVKEFIAVVCKPFH